MKDTSKLAIAHTTYPFEYNKNNPTKDYNKWQEYLQQELASLYAPLSVEELLKRLATGN